MDARDSLHGLPAATIAQLCRVSLKTARRWRQQRRAPAGYAQLLELLVDGHLGAVDRSWSEWKVSQGKLITPDGWELKPNEIRALPLRLAQIRALERQLEFPEQRSMRF